MNFYKAIKKDFWARKKKGVCFPRFSTMLNPNMTKKIEKKNFTMILHEPHLMFINC